MLKTPLYDRHVALGGRMVDFAGWAMPVQYTTIVEEHQSVRSRAGLFDISHMGRLRLSGPDAVPLVERLVTCRVATMAPGQVRYGLVTNEAGGILDDVLVYRPSDGVVSLVVNASNREKIVGWVERHLADFDVDLVDETFGTAMIALQGPGSAAILSRQLGADLGGIKYYRTASGRLFGTGAEFSRTGYTGEDGFELVVRASDAPRVWDGLLASEGVTPCGLGCRDTLRLEAGMPLYGHELTEGIDPVSAGLGFATVLDKDFVGRDAVAGIAARGPEKVRVGLRLAGRRIAREGTQILAGDELAGVVTSGTFSPTLSASIAMGYVSPTCADQGTRLEVDVRGKTEEATVVPLPFYRRAKS